VVVVLAGHLVAVAVKDDERRGVLPAAAARLAERVRREVGGVDGRGHAARVPRSARQWAPRRGVEPRGGTVGTVNVLAESGSNSPAARRGVRDRVKRPPVVVA
jgi:hypothetical protein